LRGAPIEVQQRVNEFADRQQKEGHPFASRVREKRWNNNKYK
jgi:hypothetical protein